MKENLPPLLILSNGVIVPTEELIIAIHDRIISYRKEIGKDDTPAIRDRGLITYLCDSLMDRMHKYKNNVFENALYVATETFYYIACQHPFHDGNKSTAYISALLILYVNILNNNEPAEHFNIEVEVQHSKKEFIAAPKEAEEISKLAEAGKDETELKKLIKRFLYNSIRVKP